MSGGNPPEGSSETAEAKPQFRYPEKDELWRRERYLKMGFEQISAFMLASDRALDYKRVELALERGMTHDQAMRIFT